MSTVVDDNGVASVASLYPNISAAIDMRELKPGVQVKARQSLSMDKDIGTIDKPGLERGKYKYHVINNNSQSIQSSIIP